MKKIIATSAIALALFVPLGSAAVASETPAPATGTVQAATDTIQIQGPPVIGYGKMLDIYGKAGTNHSGERPEIFRDGQRVDDGVRAPKVDSSGHIYASVESGAKGSHSYEVRLFNSNGQMTAVSNVISVYTQ